jgi:hypothetical protein
MEGGTPDYSNAGKMISYLQSIQQGAILSGTTSALTARQHLSLSIMAAQAQQQQQLQQQLQQSGGSALPAKNLMMATDQYRYAGGHNNSSSSSSSSSSAGAETKSMSLLEAVRMGSIGHEFSRAATGYTDAAEGATHEVVPASSSSHSHSSHSSQSHYPDRPSKLTAKHGGVGIAPSSSSHSSADVGSPKKHGASPARGLFGHHNVPQNLFGNDASASSLQAIKSELAASLTPPSGTGIAAVGGREGDSYHAGAQQSHAQQQAVHMRSPSILSRSRTSPHKPMSAASMTSSSASGSGSKGLASPPGILRSPAGRPAASHTYSTGKQTDPQTRSTMRRMGNLDLEGSMASSSSAAVASSAATSSSGNGTGVSTPPRHPSPQQAQHGHGHGHGRKSSQGGGATASPGSSYPSGKLLDLAGAIEDRYRICFLLSESVSCFTVGLRCL